MNTMCINSYGYNVINCARLRLKANMATDKGKDRNETGTLNKEMKLE